MQSGELGLIPFILCSISQESLQRRHNGCDGVSNHMRFDCLFNRLFRRRSKKTSKLRVTGLCEGNPPVTGGSASQRASNAENVSISWRHHIKFLDLYCVVLSCCLIMVDSPISFRVAWLSLRQTHDCPSASETTLVNKPKYTPRGSTKGCNEIPIDEIFKCVPEAMSYEPWDTSLSVISGTTILVPDL